jgi:DNA-binding MarR family transcriptional regulator
MQRIVTSTELVEPSVLQIEMLAVLHRSGPQRQSALAHALDRHPTAVARSIASLHKSGLVERARSVEENRFRTTVWISQEGTVALRNYAAKMATALAGVEPADTGAA